MLLRKHLDVNVWHLGIFAVELIHFAEGVRRDLGVAGEVAELVGFALLLVGNLVALFAQTELEVGAAADD